MRHIQVLNSFLFALFISMLFSCGPSVVNPVKNSRDSIGETMIRVNKYLVDQDSMLIEKYAQRRNISLKISENGLFYSITKSSNSKKAATGSLVTIDFRLELLDGTYCNSSDSTGVKEFTIGERKEAVGLEEGVSLLGEGDEAILIIPPHLAFGLTGDGDRIPPRAVLVYTIRVLKISK